MSEIKIKNENENEINTEINSSFEKLNDNCLANLKILSALQIGQKLSFSEGKFFIDVDSYATSGARWWNNESRNTTIKNLENFVSNVFKSIDSIYKNETNLENEYYTDIVGVSKTFKEENSTILLTYTSEINNCIKGLSNLKQTYKTDISTVSSLDIIIEKLNVRVKKIQGLLSIKNNNVKNVNDDEELPSY